MKNCLLCNKEYVHTGNNSKFCSNECRKIRKREVCKNFRLNHLESELKRHRDYNNQNKNIVKKSAKSYYYRNVNKAKTSSRKEKLKNYQKLRRQSDSLFKLSGNTRNLIKNYLKNGGYRKSKKTENILGCSFVEFKTHLENLFKDGMCWENYGSWELDHINPISSATNEQEMIQLNNYLNFQPLWKSENRSKSNSTTWQIV